MNDLLKTVLSRVEVGLLVLNEELRIVFWNDWLKNITGLTSKQVEGQKLDDLYPLYKRNIYQSTFKNALLLNQSMFFSGALHPLFFPCAEGKDETKEMVQNMQVEHIEAEGRSYLLIQVFDMTKQQERVDFLNKIIKEIKKAHDQLRKSEERLLEAQRIAQIGNWEWDIENGNLDWSDEIFRILGLKPGSFKPNYQEYVRRIHPDDKLYVKKCIDGALKGESYSVEHRIVRNNGEVAWVYDRGVVAFSFNGHPIKMYGTTQDITIRKKTEEKLANYNKEITDKNKELEHLYNIVDREIDKAKILHKQFLPKDFPAFKHLSFAVHYKAAKKLGGDYYDVVKLDDKLLVYLADVSGHGLDGTLMTIFVRETINNYLNLNKELSSVTPSSIMGYVVSRYKQENFSQDYFISIFVGVLDLNTKEFLYSNAGLHTTPLVFQDGRKSKLDSCGLPISSALKCELMDYPNNAFQLSQDSSLLFFTDGFIETRKDGDIYGEQRMEQVFSKNNHLPPDLAVTNILDDFYNYLGNSELDDDLTLLMLKIEKDKKENSLQIESSFSEIYTIESEIEDFLFTNLEEPHMFFIGIHEMIVNAMEHGNCLNKQKKVTVNLIATNKYVQISIEDEGQGFPWREKLKSELVLKDYAERGRGIAMTKMYCDYIYYNKKGNKVFLVKLIGG